MNHLNPGPFTVCRDHVELLIKKFPQIKEKILVIGDVGVDKYTSGEVKRISPEAPVPVLEVNKEWQKLGLAANVTDNLNALMIQSLLVSVIGDDQQGELLRQLMRKNELSEAGLVVLSDRKTTMKERILTKTQQICRVDYETLGDLSATESELFLKKIVPQTSHFSALIIEDYGKGLITEVVTRKMMDQFLNDKKMVLVDPSRKTPPHYFRGATLLKPNREEAQIMAQALGHRETNMAAIARLLVDKLKLEKIVITLGEEGMGLIDTQEQGGGEFVIIPTFAREVYDVSGAGDTAISALGASLLAGASLREAVYIANCASSVVVSKRGTATCSHQELSDFFDSQHSE